jgi:hypothetical protein
VSVIDINDAFHTLIDTGTLADNAYQKITDALTHGDLGLWCGSRKIELHEIRSRLRFTIRGDDLLVGSAEALGWPPGMYVFAVDTAEFERLQFSPDRHDIKNLILREAQRRERENLQVNAGILHRWIDDSRKDKRSLPTLRSVRMWLATWRREQKLATARIKTKRKYFRFLPATAARRGGYFSIRSTLIGCFYIWLPSYDTRIWSSGASCAIAPSLSVFKNSTAFRADGC